VVAYFFWATLYITVICKPKIPKLLTMNLLPLHCVLANAVIFFH